MQRMTVCFLISLPVLAHAQWVGFYDSPESSSYFLESKASLGPNNIVFSSFATTYSSPQSIKDPKGILQSYQSKTATFMYDCKSAHYAIVDTLYYRNATAAGEMFAFDPETFEQIQWLSPSANSISESLVKRIKNLCG